MYLRVLLQVKMVVANTVSICIQVPDTAQILEARNVISDLGVLAEYRDLHQLLFQLHFLDATFKLKGES